MRRNSTHIMLCKVQSNRAQTLNKSSQITIEGKLVERRGRKATGLRLQSYDGWVARAENGYQPAWHLPVQVLYCRTEKLCTKL